MTDSKKENIIDGEPDEDIVLAVDLGGTNLRTAAVNRAGKILCRTKRETPNAGDAAAIVRLILDCAAECIEQTDCKGKVSAIAAAVPGTVDIEKGTVVKAPNLKMLDEFRLAEALEKELQISCSLENDANAAAIGESWLGASKTVQHSIFVTLGTGIGGGIISEGKLLRGADGTAGEIGHLCVEPSGAPCGCGSRGCVEQYASATAVVRLRNELAAHSADLPSASDLTAQKIYEAAREDDKLALEVFRQQGFYLGIALSGLINILNPEIIVIGGGAAAAWDLFMPHMLVEIDKRAYGDAGKRVKIVRAELGDDAGILGAARLAFDRISTSVFKKDF